MSASRHRPDRRAPGRRPLEPRGETRPRLAAHSPIHV